MAQALFSSSPELAVSSAELERFRREGYLVRRGLLDRALVRAARKTFWDAMPRRFDPHDASTWTGDVEDERGTCSIRERVGRVKLRGAYRELPLLLELLPRDPGVRRVAEALADGHPLDEPVRVRGIYATFPVLDEALSEVDGHCDEHRFRLGVTGYLVDVVSRGGCFTVWPGSHRTSARGRRGRPIPGRAGDAIFWHPHLCHAPGRNRTRSVRIAVLSDFRDAR